MALDNTRLGDAIVARLQALNPGIDAGEVTRLQPVWEAIADEIIKEFESHAVVNVTGVQTGSGTATGTIS